jgi:zinc and cadmium transporter
MHPVLLSLLLGSTAAAANVFGGTIIVQKNWDRSYLKYFVALGAGFMLATATLEIIPASLDLREKDGPFLILAGYLITHFFEHTVTPHFHFGEETHADQFVATHKGFSVLVALVIHTFFDGIAIASGFIVANWLGWMIFVAIFLHKIPEGFTISSVMLASGRSRRVALGASVLLGGNWPPSVGRCNDLCGRLRLDARGQPRTGSKNGGGGASGSGYFFLIGSADPLMVRPCPWGRTFLFRQGSARH